jgi:hypothetical protein
MKRKKVVKIAVFALMMTFIAVMFSSCSLRNIENSMKEGLLELVNSLLQSSGELLTTALTPPTGESDGVFSEFLPGALIGEHPAEFQKGTVWTIVENITNIAIVPIAAFVLMLVICNDLIQTLLAGNTFGEIKVEVLIKWFVKAVIGLLIVANVYYIATGIFTFGTYAGIMAMGSLSLDLSEVTFDGVSGIEEIPTLIVLNFLALLVLIGVIVLLGAIIITLSGRLIEIFMYLAVSPIPAATLMNDEWKSVGHNWLKGLIALSFQGFFVIIALAIFSALFTNVVAGMSVEMANESGDHILGMAILIAYLFTLVFTVMRSGQISKSIFNAS